MEQRTVGFKVIGKTMERGLFGTKYYLALQLTDERAFGKSVGRTATMRVRFDQYCAFNEGDQIMAPMESEDGQYWRFV